MEKDTLISYLAVVKIMMLVFCLGMNLKYHTKMTRRVQMITLIALDKILTTTLKEKLPNPRFFDLCVKIFLELELV